LISYNIFPEELLLPTYVGYIPGCII